MDDFAKKMNDLGQDALKQAKKLKDIAKLNIDIVSEEDARKNHYVALGKMYYEAFSTDPDEKLENICDLIGKSNSRIAELRKDLRKIKKLGKCPGCGLDVKLDAIFCPFCGTETVFSKTEEEVPNSVKKCSGCGTKISASMVYCPKCGLKI